MKREIVEVCPQCEAENIREWDVEKNGYEIQCSNCHKKMMLCDECLHADDNRVGKCDWSQKYGCFRKISNEDRKVKKPVCKSKAPATLEEILQDCFGCKKPFRKEKKYVGCDEALFPIFDYLTEAGHIAYGKLTSAVYALEAIGIIQPEESERIVEELDEIVDGRQY